MNADFANAMCSAMNLISDQKLVEATCVIQSALSGEPVSSEAPSEARVVRRAIQHKVIDLMAEVIEPETIASAELTADKRLDQSQPSRIAWNAASLGEALAKLRQMELPRISLDGLRVGRPRKTLEIPEGAQFLSRSFTCAAGSRNYKLYI